MAESRWEELARGIGDLTGIAFEEFGGDQEFASLGIDSIALLEIVVYLDDSGVQLPDEALLRCRTIRDFRLLVDSELARQETQA